MAFYVLISKEMEDDDKVVYQFGPNEYQLGLLELNKNDGTVTEIKSVSTNNSSALFLRAATKIRQHWKEGNFPEKTCWAS